MKYIFTQNKSAFLPIVNIQSINIRTRNLAAFSSMPGIYEHDIMLDQEWVLGKFKSKETAIKEIQSIAEFIMSEEILYEVRKELDELS